MTLGEFVHRQNGTPLPIWGYGLRRFVYDPLRLFGPPAMAGLATFVVSGALHDGAVTLVRGPTTVVMTPWFLLVGIGAYVGRLSGMDLSRSPGRGGPPS